MPGGLPEVVQPVGADASKYVSEYRAALQVTKELSAANKELRQSIGSAFDPQAVQQVSAAARAIADFGKAVGDTSPLRDAQRSFEALGVSVQGASAELAKASIMSGQTMRSSFATLSTQAQATARDVRDVGAAHSELAAIAQQHVRQASSGRSVIETIGTRQELSDASTGLRDVTSQLSDLETRARSTRSALADIGAGSQGVSWASSLSAGDAAIIAANLARQGRGVNPNTSADRAAAITSAMNALNAGGGGGGGGGITPVLAPGGGGGHGGGGGGGGLPGGAGAFVPWRGGGFQAVKFWGMAIAEFAATAVPALVAAGAASLVGMKGAEQVITRAKAISEVSSALGPAYGITAGSYIGTSGALGRYQSLAAGGVTELAGAGINFANAGSGMFGQFGLNTLSMIDRGTANMLINYKSRQAGGGLGGMLAGGTQDLRRYGDLFSNLGDTVMNLAPNEPGIGGDVLNSLVGGTGLLKQISQDVPGPLLGALMAVEGGHRWGKAVLSGSGLLGRVLGLGKVGGIGGLLGKAGGAIAEGAPLGSGLEGAGFGLAGLGGGLEAAGGPISIAAALSAYGLSYLASTMPSASMRQVAGLQAGIGNAGFSSAFSPLAKAIVTTTGLGAIGPGRGPAGDMGVMQSPEAAMRFGPQGQTNQQVYQAAATGFTQTMGDLVNAGPQLVGALKKAGLKGVSMADAFQIAQNALLDTSHAFGKDGKLNKTALQMLENYGTAIKPMTQSAGGFNAAIAAQQIMSQPAMTALQGVNSAMDSMTSIMTGGPAGMAGLMTMIGGAHAPGKTPAALGAMGQALTSFTSAGGAAAWSKYAGSSGVITAEEQNLDQLRSYMTLGALGLQGKSGAQGIAGFQLQQLLPMAKQSPAALAMLMQQGAQMGIGGYYDSSKSQGQNFAAEQKALASMAGSAAQVSKGMNHAVEASSNLPKTAMQFTQGINALMASQREAQGAKDIAALKQHAGKGLVDKSALQDLENQFHAAGFQGGQALANSIDAALKQGGIGKAMRVKIEAQLDTSQAQAAIRNLTHLTAQPKVTVKAEVAAAQAAINAIKGKDIPVNVKESGAEAVRNAIDSIHGKNVTVTITTINRLITQAVGAGVINAPGGVLSATMVGGPAGMRITGHQTGGLVPGSGSGDIIPSMLEPGEAIVPRNLVPLVAPILAAHNVPGFGATPRGGTHFALGGIVPHMLGFPDPARTSGNVGKDVAYSLVDGITKALDQAGAGKIAQALVNKISTEVQYAKSISSQAQQGLNLGGLDLTQGSVTDQMQSYLGSEKSFAGDIGTLRKQHLSQGIMQQLIAAGPVQGDALAQSILQGGGTSGKSGVSQVNALWAQIGKASNAIGAQAAMAKYGGSLSGDLKHAEASQSHVTINVNAGGGSGNQLNLTQAQIKSIVAQVQAALLKQAKRNPSTGLQLKGKGA